MKATTRKITSNPGKKLEDLNRKKI